jgi:hypothetical protein
MNQDDIIDARYFEGGLYIKISDHLQAVRSAVAVDRENVAKWMVERGYATGHGDTIEDLLKELEWQVAEREREACAKFCDDQYEFYGFDHVFAAGIRAREKK